MIPQSVQNAAKYIAWKREKTLDLCQLFTSSFSRALGDKLELRCRVGCWSARGGDGMKRYLRMFLAFSVVFLAMAFCNAGLVLACDEAAIRYNMEEESPESAHTVAESKGTLKCGTRSPEALPLKCASPPLREKPQSFGPIVWAVAVAGTAIVMILRRRKASMLVLGASLAGLFVAIGYLWSGS